MRVPFSSAVAGATVLVAISAIAGIAANLVAPGGLPLATPPQPESAPSIEFAETYEAFESGETVFLDARPEGEYRDGHIAGAINVPVITRQDALPELQASLPKDKKIIVYCDGEECAASNKVAAMLLQEGYRDVHVFSAGFYEWQNAQLPVNQGETP